MAESKRLGIYFGDTTFSITEVKKRLLANVLVAPYDAFDPNKNFTAIGTTDEPKVANSIQKLLSDKQMDSTEISLALPSRDIILRSFIIPWMTLPEIRGVVEFEVKRYIPFKLDELIYAYHSTTITEKKSKKIQILFMAIRSDALERYCRIVEQVGLRVNFIEPAVLSLLRILLFKKVITAKEKVAIVHIEGEDGTIIITNQGIPQFLRDFRLPASMKDPNLAAESGINLAKEVRISLDYYYRQHKQTGVDRIVLLSHGASEVFSQSLNKETEIATTPVLLDSLLESNASGNMGILFAWGIALQKSISVPVNIDLEKSRVQASQPVQSFGEAPINYILTAKYAIGCAIVLLLLFLVLNFSISGYTQKAASYKTHLGPYESLTIEDIKKKNEIALNKIETLKNVRLRSNVAYFLNAIPEMLPEGVWLTNLKITCSDLSPSPSTGPEKRRKQPFKEGESPNVKISIDISGYAYDEDVNAQIKIVNRLVEKMGLDKNFSKIFKKIILASANQQNLNEYIVTQFQLTCE